MLFGISRIMLKDADIGEIRKVFSKYDTKKTGKISLEQFLLACINGMLKKSLTDEMVTDTFINVDPEKKKKSDANSDDK